MKIQTISQTYTYFGNFSKLNTKEADYVRYLKDIQLRLVRKNFQMVLRLIFIALLRIIQLLQFMLIVLIVNMAIIILNAHQKSL